MGSVISEFGSLVGSAGRDIQCSVVPDSATTVIGAIIQYIGQTDSNYINGYFYKNTSDGWVQENVQPETNISGKADKVTGATNGNFAALNASGNLTDSGKKASDLVLKSDVKDVLNSTSTTDPLSANQGRLVADNLAANENVYGAKNLGIPLVDMTYLNLSTSNSADGSLTVTTNGLACGGVSANWSSSFILKKGTYQVSFGLDTDETPSLTGFAVILKVYSTNYWLCTSGDSAASRKITLAADTEVIWGLYCESGTVVATQTVYPMIRDARITDPTFAAFAETNLQLTKKTSGLSNENLLDNSWFTVNQRGVTSGGFDVSYKMDRWQTSYTANTSGAWSLISSGLSIDTTNVLSGNNYFAQTFSASLDTSKLYTASVMLSDGTVLSYVITSFPASLTAPFGSLYITATDFTITIGAGKTVTFRAVKLEVGSVSTLANDVEPNYTTELLKCQRYFYRVLSNSSSAFIAVGFMADSHTFYGTINLPVPMRGTPTSLFGGVLQLYTTGGTEDVSTLLINMRSPQILTIAATSGNSLTVNSPAILMGVANSYIDISADL